MPYYKKIQRLSVITLTLLISYSVFADFVVSEVKPSFQQKVLVLNGSLDLNLSSKADEALNKGIPLDITIDIKLYRQRIFIWNENLGSWKIKRRIRYHALSRQYLVYQNLDKPEIVENFTSLNEALKHKGALNELKLPFKAEIMKEYTYIVKIRAQLNIEALPAPLRPVAYASPSWHLNSGWSTWKVLQ